MSGPDLAYRGVTDGFTASVRSFKVKLTDSKTGKALKLGTSAPTTYVSSYEGNKAIAVCQPGTSKVLSSLPGSPSKLAAAIDKALSNAEPGATDDTVTILLAAWSRTIDRFPSRSESFYDGVDADGNKFRLKISLSSNTTDESRDWEDSYSLRVDVAS
ncbi:hypothetical protein [Kitasatospora sp. NPDC091207]|uniref:hypothetical protein n=1 Tax=Kitasatospora sp. NPDC091207 TaxID=3364083 RepID=UPI0037F1A58D